MTLPVQLHQDPSGALGQGGLHVRHHGSPGILLALECSYRNYIQSHVGSRIPSCLESPSASGSPTLTGESPVGAFPTGAPPGCPQVPSCPPWELSCELDL